MKILTVAPKAKTKDPTGSWSRAFPGCKSQRERQRQKPGEASKSPRATPTCKAPSAPAADAVVPRKRSHPPTVMLPPSGLDGQARGANDNTLPLRITPVPRLATVHYLHPYRGPLSDEAFERLYARLFESNDDAEVIQLFPSAEREGWTARDIAAVRLEDQQRGKRQ